MGIRVRVADILSGSGSSYPGQYMEILVGDTLYFDATDGSSGIELWAHQPGEITSLSSGSGSGSGGMTNVTNATSCVASPSLPTGLSIDSSTCTISGTPSVESSNATYTITANISNTTFQTTIWLSSSYLELTPSAEGADLIIDEAMTNITFQYNASAASGSGSGSGTTTNGNGTTWQVADINSGADSSYPGQFMEILVGDTLYFDATDGSSGKELWAHDTSNASTWQVADISSGSGHSWPGQYTPILVGDTLYFSAYDGSRGQELLATHTSKSSTSPVADICTLHPS